VVFFFKKKLEKKIRQIAKIRLQGKKKKNWLPVITADTEGTRKWGLQTLISPPVRLADGRCARASESVSDA
jgi:hypothetical protein